MFQSQSSLTTLLQVARGSKLIIVVAMKIAITFVVEMVTTTPVTVIFEVELVIAPTERVAVEHVAPGRLNRHVAGAFVDTLVGVGEVCPLA
jgi:hypothetical protein